MFGLLRKLRQDRERKRISSALYAEMLKNLETCQVMRQLGELRVLRMESWQKFSERKKGSSSVDLFRYAETLAAYNECVRDFKDCEKWYAADLNHKTQANARVLESKKHIAEEKSTGLEGIIAAAGRATGKYVRR